MSKGNTKKPEEKKAAAVTEQQQEKDTTLKIDPELKGVLEGMRTDPNEPLKGVIRRLVTGQTPMESTQDVKTVDIPDKTFQLMVMILPENFREVLRRGVR